MSGPLSPYRVLDLSGDLGALCGRMLADLGADVIKFEPPAGDPARMIGPFADRERHPEKSLSWLYFNAGKRGIRLDLVQAAGRDLLLRLTAVSDFVIESFPPGYLDDLGLGYDSLAAENPAIVLVSITPFGRHGPYRHFKATDLIGWAMGGQMELDGDLDRPPVRVSVPQAWGLAGAQAAAGAMVAHRARQRTGIGQQVDVSAQECVVWTLMIAAQTWDILQINSRRGGSVRGNRRAGGRPVMQRVIWPCRDGYIWWTPSGGGQAGGLASMRALVRWMEDEDAAGETSAIDWLTLPVAALDQDAYDRMITPFQQFFLSKTKQELFEGAVARAIQLAPANTLVDLMESPQLAAREYFVAVEHPSLGLTLQFPGAPVKLSRTPWKIGGRAPKVGEHNRDVYGDLLGMDDEALMRLKARLVI